MEKIKMEKCKLTNKTKMPGKSLQSYSKLEGGVLCNQVGIIFMKTNHLHHQMVDYRGYHPVQLPSQVLGV